MKDIKIQEIKDFQLGNAQDIENGTGCTVILCPKGAIAGVDVRGGGPATRETDLLKPENMVQQIHAVCLSGGSAFGLEAGSGVMQYLSEHQIGFDMKGIYIPIVSQACLFDCSVANMKAYPNKEMGYQACQNINEPFLSGNVGAGTGASVGKCFGFDCAMKSGLGQAAVSLNELQVGAIVAVNACGDIYKPDSQERLAGAYDYNLQKELNSEQGLLQEQPQENTNTTIGCIITNAKLTKAQMNKVASMTHDAFARCIRPVHTSNDGDTIFAMASQQVEANQDIVGILAIQAMMKAIVDAVTSANEAYQLKSYKSFH